MSSSLKTILASLGAIIIIASAVYFSKPKEIEQLAPSTRSTQKASQVPRNIYENKPEPDPRTSSSDIIDYLVDGLTKSETETLTSLLEATTSEQSYITISTNF